MEIEPTQHPTNPKPTKEAKDQKELSVKVALRVRPLQPKEIMEGSRKCIEVNPGKNEVHLHLRQKF